MHRQPVIYVFGPVVADRPTNEAISANSDLPLDVEAKSAIVGGLTVEIARQAKPLGVSVQLHAVVGEDESGRLAARAVASEFPGAVGLPLLDNTQTFARTGKTFTVTRTALTKRDLPQSAVQRVWDAHCSVITPLMPGDYDVVRELLSLGRRTILLLSAEQLADTGLASDLGSRAWLVVLNRTELQTWVGTRDPDLGITRLRSSGVHQVLVTTPQGVHVAVTGFEGFCPGYQPRGITAPPEPGAVFLGTLMATIAQHGAASVGWPQAIQRGLAAECLSAENNIGAAHDPAAISRFMAVRPLLVRNQEGAILLSGRLPASTVTAAAALLAAVTIPFWLG